MTNVDEAGVVSLLVDAGGPQVGSAVETFLFDPDGGVTGLTWAWARSADQSAWEAIAGASQDAYTPTDGDAGRYLRATAYYTDAEGPGKTALATTASPVTALLPGVTPEPVPLPQSQNAATISAVAISSAPGADQTYAIGDAITATVTYSAAVTVAGTPTLALTVGSNTRQAAYSAGSTTATLTFSYTVVEGDADEDGVSVTGGDVITLPTASDTIKVGAADAGVAFSAGLAAQSGHMVDGIRPKVTHFTMASTPAWDNTYWRGEKPALTIHFSEPITLTGDLSLDVDYGGVATNFIPLLVTDPAQDVTEVTSFKVGGPVIHSDYFTAAGISVPSAQSGANAGTTLGDVKDAAGNTADNRLSHLAGDTAKLGPFPNHRVNGKLSTDTGLPSITAAGPAIVSRPVSGDTYGPGEVITVRLTFTEVVDADSGSLAIRVGANSRLASIPAAVTNTTTVDFRYTVVASDVDANGVSVPANALTFASDIERYASQDDARFNHVALDDQPGHKVHPYPPFVVPSSWPFVPEGLEVGDTFRLLFVTAPEGSAEETGIASYNDFVQGAARESATLKPLSGGFRALISADLTNARDNTHTTGAGEPIYWLGGPKVADDYADFYDGQWDSQAAHDVSGTATGNADVEVWTGSNSDGTRHGADAAGFTTVMTGRTFYGGTAQPGKELDSGFDWASTFSHRFYALSPVIRVGPAVECDAPGVHGSNRGWRCYVGADWGLVPDGLNAGDRFRLMFVTSDGRNGELNTIAPYNTHVQAAANRNPSLAPFSDHFRAYAHDWTVTAKPNTRTRGSDVDAPVYWLGGAKVADDYADMFGGSWDSNSPTDETVAALAAAAPMVWTGSNQNGTNAATLQMGNDTPRYGNPKLGGSELGGGTTAKATALPLYGLSPVMVVTDIRCTPSAEAGLASDKKGQRCVVPHDWPAIPDGIGADEGFRLLFVTADPIAGDKAGGVAPYNAFAQIAADKNPLLRPFGGAFRALVSASDVDARGNTKTRADDAGENDPIHWTPACDAGGCRGAFAIAGRYAEFYDGAWDYPAGKTNYSRTETGAAQETEVAVWTGSDEDGTSDDGNVLNNDNPATGRNQSGDEINHATAAKAVTNPIYGISPLLTVAPGPPAQPTGLKARPGDAQVRLFWTDPADADITVWQYSQRDQDYDDGSNAQRLEEGGRYDEHAAEGDDHRDAAE